MPVHEKLKMLTLTQQSTNKLHAILLKH